MKKTIAEHFENIEKAIDELADDYNVAKHLVAYSEVLDAVNVLKNNMKTTEFVEETKKENKKWTG